MTYISNYIREKQYDTVAKTEGSCHHNLLKVTIYMTSLSETDQLGVALFRCPWRDTYPHALWFMLLDYSHQI
jgi:hypothetical protein